MEGPFLALDIGEARIGVAVSDPTGLLASALTVVPVKSRETALQKIVQLVQETGALRVILGLPRSMNGELQDQARRVQQFAERLRSRLEIPLIFWDERLSTVAAQREMQAAGISSQRRKRIVDAVAAALILQNYLDYCRHQAPRDSE